MNNIVYIINGKQLVPNENNKISDLGLVPATKSDFEEICVEINGYIL